jgi:hypothetical protein
MLENIFLPIFTQEKENMHVVMSFEQKPSFELVFFLKHNFAIKSKTQPADF